MALMFPRLARNLHATATSLPMRSPSNALCRPRSCPVGQNEDL